MNAKQSLFSVLVVVGLLGGVARVGAVAQTPSVTPGNSAAQQVWYDKFYISPGLGVLLFNSFAPSHDTLAPMLRVGYRVNEIFDLELGGMMTRLDDRNDMRTPHQSFRQDNAYGAWLDAVFHLTRWERFDPFVTVGAGQFWAANRDNALPRDQAHFITPRLGIGAQYHLDDHWSLRAGATWMSPEFHINEHFWFYMIDAGVSYAFGGGRAPAAPVTPVAAVAAPAPAPAPVVKSSLPALEAEVKEMHAKNAPLPPDLLLVTLEMEFDYDVSIIRPEYYDQLDAIAKVLLNHPEASALIEGHCDQRVLPNGVRSSKEYNQRLSELRAAATVKYLTEKGVAAERMKAVGYGFTRPKDPSKVDLKHGNPENRRVEVYINNVGGTKAGEAEYRGNLKK